MRSTNTVCLQNSILGTFASQVTGKSIWDYCNVMYHVGGGICLVLSSPINSASVFDPVDLIFHSSYGCITEQQASHLSILQRYIGLYSLAHNIVKWQVIRVEWIMDFRWHTSHFMAHQPLHGTIYNSCMHAYSWSLERFSDFLPCTWLSKCIKFQF